MECDIVDLEEALQRASEDCVAASLEALVGLPGAPALAAAGDAAGAAAAAEADAAAGAAAAAEAAEVSKPRGGRLAAPAPAAPAPSHGHGGGDGGAAGSPAAPVPPLFPVPAWCARRVAHVQLMAAGVVMAMAGAEHPGLRASLADERPVFRGPYRWGGGGDPAKGRRAQVRRGNRETPRRPYRRE
jgi:hypothetical protein